MSAVTEVIKSELFPRLEAMRTDGESRLTVETCDGRERDMRDRLQRQMDNEIAKIERLRDKIVNVMTVYSQDYPAETREVDVSIEAAGEYRKMLAELVSDGLPQVVGEWLSEHNFHLDSAPELGGGLYQPITSELVTALKLMGIPSRPASCASMQSGLISSTRFPPSKAF